MLKSLLKGLFGRLLGYAGLLLGFWWLREALVEVNYPLGLLGGLTILAAMILVVGGRRRTKGSSRSQLSKNELSCSEEDNPGDSLNGGNESDKLPP